MTPIKLFWSSKIGAAAFNSMPAVSSVSSLTLAMGVSINLKNASSARRGDSLRISSAFTIDVEAIGTCLSSTTLTRSSSLWSSPERLKLLVRKRTLPDASVMVSTSSSSMFLILNNSILASSMLPDNMASSISNLFAVNRTTSFMWHNLLK